MGRRWGVFNTPLHGDTKTPTFSTSHPIASPKGSLFFVFHLKTCPGRDHFSTVRVGAYGIRPTKWPRRGQECASTIDHLDHSPHKWVAGRAYSIRPYTGTCKRTTFSTSHPIVSPKRSLFFVSHRKTCPERDHFSAVRVGAYYIRPTKWPRRGQECASVIDRLDHSPHKWVVCGAYAIRPYTGIRKCGAVYAYHNRETIKRATVHAFHRTECPDCDAVETCTDVGWGERKKLFASLRPKSPDCFLALQPRKERLRICLSKYRIKTQEMN